MELVSYLVNIIGETRICFCLCVFCYKLGQGSRSARSAFLHLSLAMGSKAAGDSSDEELMVSAQMTPQASQEKQKYGAGTFICVYVYVRRLYRNEHQHLFEFLMSWRFWSFWAFAVLGAFELLMSWRRWIFDTLKCWVVWCLLFLFCCGFNFSCPSRQMEQIQASHPCQIL